MVKAFNAYTEGELQLSPHFKVKEFQCKDGSGAVLVSLPLVQVLERIRAKFGKPVTINSGYRNKSYNRDLGSSDGSQHCQGTAADITIKGVTPRQIAVFAETLLPDGGGIGLYEYASGGFTHIDVRVKKARWLRKTPNGKDVGVDKFV
jgi:uncharacterized protein YcbK (DUF882 family)